MDFWMKHEISKEQTIENEEYVLMKNRIAELKESIYSQFIAGCTDELDELFQTIKLLHQIELEAVYRKGLQKGSYFQRIISGETILPEPRQTEK